MTTTDSTGAARRRQVPGSTYRLQVHAGFRLEDAAGVAGYLADLGVTHAYSSPLLRSAEGSTHGYDTVDHAHIDEARGGQAGFDRLVQALHEHGLGLVLDLVPNHMGVADPAAAPWWWDVLRHGKDSAHAAAFDVDWDFGGGRVRIPVLGSAGSPPGSTTPSSSAPTAWRSGRSSPPARTATTPSTTPGSTRGWGTTRTSTRW